MSQPGSRLGSLDARDEYQVNATYCRRRLVGCARISCAPLRGLPPPLAAARLWLLGARDWYRVAMKIQCCINVTARCAASALRGVLGRRSYSPHVRALHPRPYSRVILIALPFVLYIVVRTRS
jgi:hypothetical protein